MKTKINIAIAEDHVILRQGLIALFKHFEEIQVLFDVGDGKELLEKVETIKPDIILLDINMPVMNGSQALDILNKNHNHIHVIILSNHFNDFYINNFIQKGAAAYLAKDCGMEKLTEAINTVYATGRYYDERTLEALSKDDKSIHSDPILATKINLTEREEEILSLLRLNKSNSEIAHTLGISLRTVEGHRSNLMHKSGCKNLAALVSKVNPVV
jgi:DNA-binding NarL/FixJ family response regulator